MNAPEERNETTQGTPAIKTAEVVSAVENSQPATQQQLAEVKQELSAFEKATLRWTRTTAGIGLVTAAFICLQWCEMRSGSGDTHSLAVAAGKQADRMQDFVNRMQSQVDRTKDLADRMKDQADRTRTIAEQAVIQARAANTSADAAINTAQIGQQQLDASQRPWITEVAQIGTPIEFNVNGVSITFLFTLDNIGHSPAEKVWVEAKLINTIASGMPSIEEHQRVCGGPTGVTPKNFTLGEILFPSKPFSWGWTWTIPWSEIQGQRAPNLLGPLLYGCIEYNYGLSSKRHSTPFRYVVVQTDGRLLVQDGGFNVSTKGIPPSMLTLRRDGVLGQPTPD